MTTIITGASRGIGKAVAELEAIRFWRSPLVLVARDEARLKQLQAKIDHDGGQAFIVVGDVAERKTAEAAVALAKEISPYKQKITNLVCCAGTGKGSATETLDSDDWTRVMRVNLDGALNFIQACLPEMLEHANGNIVLMSSIAGVAGFKRQAAYTASKHALVGLAKSLAKEHGKRGISCIPICPGFVDTDMTEQVVQGLMKHRNISWDAARAIIAAQNPQNRIISPVEVAEVVEFCLTGPGRNFSGNPLMMTGGE